MPRQSDKREKLLEAANALIYQRGFNQTSLSDIAHESGVPPGNVYYYFRTKDELGAAVIDERIEEFRARCAEWDRLADPRDRLRAFLTMPLALRDTLAERGCPVGTLCQELHKDENPLAAKADELLKAHLAWVTEQLRALGKADAEDLGIHFVAVLQGTSVLASSLGDPGIVDREVKRLQEFVDEL
jgi:TetR/AcrR family transcriptional repressor of nem operon